MNIAHVCPYDYFRFGGVQRHIHDLVAELNRQGIKSRVIAPGRALSPTESNTTHHADTAQHLFLAGRQFSFAIDKTQSELSWCSPREKRKLQQFLQEQQFDLIHFHTPWNPILTWQLMSMFKGKKIATFHNTPSNALSGKLLSWLFKSLSPWFLAHFDQVITVSESSLSHLRPPRQQKIHILPPCFALPQCQKSRQGFDAEERFLQKDQVFHIVYLGRLEARKGVFYLLQAFARLQQQLDCPLRLTLAGSGVDQSKTEQWIKQHHLDKVDLVDRISEAQKQQLLGSADLFCAPATEGESFGMTLLEAMSCGVPVVAFDNPGYRQLLAPQQAFCLAQTGNIDDLVSKMAYLIQHPQQRRELAHWGRHYAAQFDCKQQLKHFIKLYRQVLDE